MSILLKNGTIYPITSRSFVGDILMNKGKIERIGQGSPKSLGLKLSMFRASTYFRDSLMPFYIGIYEEGVGGYYGDGNEATDPLLEMSPLSIRSIPRTQQ